jgi:hypothetical protein
MIMKNSVTDELINKVYHLTNALSKAEKLVEVLQRENDNLKHLLHDIDSYKHEHDYEYIGA